MARTPTAAQVLGHVVLVTGKEEYLSARTVASVRDAVRAPRRRGRVRRVGGLELTARLAGRDGRAVAVLLDPLRDRPRPRGPARRVRRRAARLLRALPRDDVALVLVHSGGPKGSGVLTKLRKLAAVTEVKSEEIKPKEMPGFVAAEAPSTARKIDARRGRLPRAGRRQRPALAGRRRRPADQRLPRRPADVEKVQRYFGGRAEAKSFSVADAAFAGRRAVALEELRWALDSGTAPVLVTSAMAASARSIARYLGAPRGARDADLARDLGVPPWKVRTVRDQSRSWSDRGDRRGGAGRRRGRRRHQGRRPTTRRTRWSGWCSPWPGCERAADLS